MSSAASFAGYTSQTSYAAYLVSLAPSWLSGSVGCAFLSSLGKVLDATVQGTIDAVKVRWIQTAGSSDLDYWGRERGVPRAPGESIAGYANRLQCAWLAYAGSLTSGGIGTKSGLSQALTDTGFINAVIDRNDPVSYLLAPAFNWQRFWVRLSPPFPAGFYTTPGFVIGDGTHVGDYTARIGGYDKIQLDLLKTVIATWKPLHGFCASIRSSLATWRIGDGTLVGGGAKIGMASTILLEI